MFIKIKPASFQFLLKMKLKPAGIKYLKQKLEKFERYGHQWTVEEMGKTREYLYSTFCQKYLIVPK